MNELPAPKALELDELAVLSDFLEGFCKVIQNMYKKYFGIKRNFPEVSFKSVYPQKRIFIRISTTPLLPLDGLDRGGRGPILQTT